MEPIEKYILDFATPEDDLLRELDRVTHLKVVQPRMISGNQQGKFLEMLVRMLDPSRVLEIGTFTGYSAICMARGLGSGAELHTVEINDELYPISSEFIARSNLLTAGRVIQHTGSALDIAPGLGLKFGMVFIDGDKREYPEYYRMVMDGLVESGSYIVADNILWYGKVTEGNPKDLYTRGIIEFNRMVAEDPRVENVILPVRDGLNLIRVK